MKRIKEKYSTISSKLRGKRIGIKVIISLLSSLYLQAFYGITAFATSSTAQEIVNAEFAGFNAFLTAVVSSVGSLIVTWAIFEFGMAQQTNDGMQTSSAIKRGAGGLLMISASTILTIIT